MTKYSKLRGIAANVFERIANAADRAAYKLAAHQQRNSINEKRTETLEELNFAECNPRQANMEDIVEPVIQYFSSNEVQQQIDPVEVTAELPPSMLRKRDGIINSNINHSKSENDQDNQERGFGTSSVPGEWHDSSLPLQMNRKYNKTRIELAQYGEAEDPGRMNIDCRFEEERRHSNIPPPKKKRRTLRFNNLSRMRTFQKGEELQPNNAEYLVSTFQGDRNSEHDKKCSISNQISSHSNEMPKLSNGEAVSKFQTSEAHRPGRETKSVRINDVSRMVKFETGKSIPSSFEEHLVSTFQTSQALGKRKRYTSINDEYNNDI